MRSSLFFGFLPSKFDTTTHDKKRYKEAQKPKHFAISLAGEPTLYPKLPELIKEIHSRNMTSFLVTNGTNPSMIKKLIKNQPTQLYLTLPAPDEKTYEKVCSPLARNQWKKIIETSKLLKKFKRSTIRLTLVKGFNMIKPEKYAELIDKAASFGYEVIAITNHDTVTFSKALADYALNKGVLLIPGIERKIKGKHVLIYDITQEEADSIKDFSDLRKIKKLKIAAHPYFFISSLGKSFVKKIFFESPKG